ncbi:MAG: P-loop NTPase fold protein [Polyangiaceae bacterium]|jgi:hypothetical protein
MHQLPLLRDLNLDADVLGREPASRTLLRAATLLPEPSCLALYGAWGTGKTTMLRKLGDDWERQSRGPVVWFDPWEHEQRSDVISPLLHAIVEHVRTHKSVDQDRLQRVAVEIAKALAALSVKAAAKYLFGASKETAIGTSLDDFKAAFSEWSKYHSEVEETKKNFSALVELTLGGRSTSTLLVLVDDLDRCMPDNVVAMLEGMKLLLCARTTARVLFVCALDRSVVGDAISKRYPSSRRYSGEHYLEKIFDASVEVPPVPLPVIAEYVHSLWARQLAPLVEKLYAPVGGSQVVASVLAEPNFANPRVIKRVLNRLVLLVSEADAADRVRHWPEADVRRLLVWIAGAERFRSFRSAFVDASDAEIRSLCLRMEGEPVEEGSLGPNLFAAVSLPGFSAYYHGLGLAGRPPDAVLRERADGDERPADCAVSLREIDGLLRGYGL